jgi:hypothetical protein
VGKEGVMVECSELVIEPDPDVLVTDPMLVDEEVVTVASD